MALPGLTKEQMIEVDRIMVEELHVPIELMMENAGLNLARLAKRMNSYDNGTFIVIAGPGNNGGGGTVAARRLKSWGNDVVVHVPKGFDAMNELPRMQLKRAESFGVSIVEGLPSINHKASLIIDSYLGYGYTRRDNDISKAVFDFLSQNSTILSLDTPSGLDVTTSESASGFKPKATLTIAFSKQGLLMAYPEKTGALYVCDIGVPQSIYEKELGIKWESPFKKSSLNMLGNAFAANTIQQIEVFKSVQDEILYWEVL